MELGKKIKKIRTSKNMTQAELAGDKITRNMLSQIENGSAIPSVGTILYIAERLGMPAGYFLAEAEDDLAYQKMLLIDDVKKAYRNGDYDTCATLCGDPVFDSDDEINLILCQCHFEIGKKHFTQGKLLSAHKAFNLSLQHAEKTLYKALGVRTACYIYLELIGMLSPYLRFEGIDEHDMNDECIMHPNIYYYVKAIREIEEKNPKEAQKIVSLVPFSDTVFAEHIKAKLEMQNENYGAAYDILRELIEKKESEELGKTILYVMYSDLEICCRELKDFENAYAYATKKATMLSET